MATYLTLCSNTGVLALGMQEGGKGVCPVLDSNKWWVCQDLGCMLQSYCQFSSMYIKCENDYVSEKIRMPKSLNIKMAVGKCL